MLIDSVLGGFWAASMQFNPLPAVTILSMMMMNNVAVGGPKMMVRGLLAQLTGVLLSWLLLGVAFNPHTTAMQIYACLPMLTLYPFAVGMISYQLAIKLAEHKRTLRALSRTDSLTGLLNPGPAQPSVPSAPAAQPTQRPAQGQPSAPSAQPTTRPSTPGQAPQTQPTTRPSAPSNT